MGGVLVGVCFDVYRILRWRIGLSRISTFLGDLFFSIIAIVVLFYFAQKANYLEWRFYLFGGSLFGLLLYIRFISRQFKWFINKILNIIVALINVIVGLITSFFMGIARLLTYLMSFPYRILRWMGLLFFRIGEAVAKDTLARLKSRIGKIPRE